MEPGSVMDELFESGLLVKDAHDLVMKFLRFWHCNESPTREGWVRLFRTYGGGLGADLANRIDKEV